MATKSEDNLDNIGLKSRYWSDVSRILAGSGDRYDRSAVEHFMAYPSKQGISRRSVPNRVKLRAGFVATFGGVFVTGMPIQTTLRLDPQKRPALTGDFGPVFSSLFAATAEADLCPRSRIGLRVQMGRILTV